MYACGYWFIYVWAQCQFCVRNLTNLRQIACGPPINCCGSFGCKCERVWWSLIITIIIMLITRRAVKLTRGKHWVMSMFTKQEVEEYDFFISLLSPYSDSLMMNHACKTCIVYKHRSQCGYWLLNWNSDNWNRKPG